MELGSLRAGRRGAVGHSVGTSQEGLASGVTWIHYLVMLGVDGARVIRLQHDTGAERGPVVQGS